MSDDTDSASGPADKATAPSLFLIDSSGFVFRAYHALPALTASDGIPTGATLGFCNMLIKLIDEHQPDSIAAVFDRGTPNYRTDIFADYKANRPPAPEDLKVQFHWVKKIVEAFGIALVEQDGVEADDIIASLAEKAADQGWDVTIVSSDKDLLQITSSNVRLLDTMKNLSAGPEKVLQKYGVSPQQLGDWLALVGDTSDNVPGVPGVGAKTATKLLQQYDDLENLLAHADELKGKALRANVKNFADQARMSRKLVALRSDVVNDIALDSLVPKGADSAALVELFTKLEFKRLRSRFSTETASAAEIRVNSIEEKEDFDRFIDQLDQSPHLAIVPLIAHGGTPTAKLCGVVACCNESEAVYWLADETDEFGGRLQRLFDQLRHRSTDHTADEKLFLWSDDLKTWCAAAPDTSLHGFDGDVRLAAYVLDPSQPNSLVDLARSYLAMPLAESDAQEKNNNAGSKRIDEQVIAAGQRARAVFGLARDFSAALQNDPDVCRLFRDIEIPLAAVLAKMENQGCALDVSVLHELSAAIEGDLHSLEQAVHHEAGWPVNLNSPKQLQKLLFDQLGLTAVKKTKTGFSTDADVLADLALEHPIAAQIEQYRILSKLKNTYLDTLPQLVNSTTGRIHTSFSQTTAATGRLSSSDPNLQNIPIRTDFSRRIREAFVAPEGYVLLSADYSQIELRVLAHLSADPLLIDAFVRNQDIHARTAAEVFGVELDDVSSEQRRIAKAVNFGVIYGQSDWGLARQLRIPRQLARDFIRDYFARYAEVSRFMDRTIAEARETSMVRTLFGRRRQVSDLKSSRFNTRSAAERIVRNTPIQGTAADILKLAMIQIDRGLVEHKIDARMTLTVHDELVFEVRNDVVEQAADFVKTTMANVAELAVPLVVDVASGPNWAQAHR